MGVDVGRARLRVVGQCLVCNVYKFGVMVERDGMRRGSGGGCGWGGGVLGRWSLRRLLLDSPLVGRRLAHTGIYFTPYTKIL